MHGISKVMTIFLLIAMFASAASAREVVIGAGGFEPHFIKQDNSGLFTDIIKETFRLLPQYEIRFRWNMSIRRLMKELNNGRVHAAAPAIKNTNIRGYFSKPVFRFTDVATTLKNRHFSISSISDLKDKSVIAYEGAKRFLGEEFKKIAENNTRYTEVPEPMTGPKMVAVGKYDVCVLDIHIFLHRIKSWRGGKFEPDQFDFHRLFPDSYAYMGFKDKKVRDDFDQALEVIKKNGRYEAIYKKYLTESGYSSN